MPDYADSYEDVSMFRLSDDRERALLDAQTECCFMWTTKDGDPVGVIMNYVVARRPVLGDVHQAAQAGGGGRGPPAGGHRHHQPRHRHRRQPGRHLQGRRPSCTTTRRRRRWFYPALAARVRPESADRQAAFVAPPRHRRARRHRDRPGHPHRLRRRGDVPRLPRRPEPHQGLIRSDRPLDHAASATSAAVRRSTAASLTPSARRPGRQRAVGLDGPRANRAMASAGAAHRYSAGAGDRRVVGERVVDHGAAPGAAGDVRQRVLLDDLVQPDPDGRLDERHEHPGPVLARRAVHHDRSVADVLGHGLDGQHQLPTPAVGHVVVETGDVVGLLDARRVVGVDHPVDQRDVVGDRRGRRTRARGRTGSAGAGRPPRSGGAPRWPRAPTAVIRTGSSAR